MRRALFLLPAAVLLAAACGGGGAPPTTAGTPATSPLAVPAPSAPAPGQAVLASDAVRSAAAAAPGEVAAVAAGDAAFGAEVLAALAAADVGNLAISPLSIRLALAMVYAGARGETASQMAEVLRYELPDDALHAAWNALDQALEARNRAFAGDDGTERGIRVALSNAIWGQSGFTVEPAFLDTLASQYGAGLRVVDFARAAEAARATINAWVSVETAGRIPELVPPGALTPETLLVLTNTVYLDADWASPFPAEATVGGPFTRGDGSAVTVPFMHQVLPADYAAGEGWQAVDLPYVGGEVAMLVVVPDEGRFDEVAAAAAALFGEARSALAPTDVQLALPRFEFRARASLPETLRELGMTDAFDPARADFSGITAAAPLAISDVIHEVFVSVDEAGTEAAAATAVIMGRGGLPERPVALNADRPFLFWLYDRATGAVLFMGRVVDPSL